MDDFLVMYEVRGRKYWESVNAKNTLHAKQIVEDLYSNDMVNFIEVDFMPSITLDMSDDN